MNLSSNDFTILSRRELYERIWKTPATKLATEFGISDVGLAKACKRHRIPRPPRGYWAKLAVGKRLYKPRLPTIDDPGLEEVRIFRQQFFADTSSSEVERSATVISVSETLEKPHSLIEQTRKVLRAGKSGDDKIVGPDGASCLQIRVSRKSLHRALRIYDAFIKHWETLGGGVAVGKVDYNDKPFTELTLHGDGVPIELFEEVNRINTGRTTVSSYWSVPTYKYESTGQLVFKIDTYADGKRTRWADGKRRQLEAMLGAFTDGLIELLETKRVKRLDQECEGRQKAAVKVVREAASKSRERAEARRTQLLEEVNAWKQAEMIRDYVTAIRTRANAGGLPAGLVDGFEAWTEWANWYADSIDPLTVTPTRLELEVTPSKQSILELDLTSKTRTIIEHLGVLNTDELFEIEHAAVAKLSGSWCHSEWNEICRVLEGLGYEVAARYRGYGQ